MHMRQRLAAEASQVLSAGPGSLLRPSPNRQPVAAAVLEVSQECSLCLGQSQRLVKPWPGVAQASAACQHHAVPDAAGQQLLRQPHTGRQRPRSPLAAPGAAPAVGQAFNTPTCLDKPALCDHHSAPAQARARTAISGAAPTIKRNQGGARPHDLHMENFDISNGGAELIEVAPLPACHLACLPQSSVGQQALLHTQMCPACAAQPLHQEARPGGPRHACAWRKMGARCCSMACSRAAAQMRTCTQNATLVLALGRRYGLVGRNGTGKTTFLRAMAAHAIKGIPDNVQACLKPAPGPSWQGLLQRVTAAKAAESALHIPSAGTWPAALRLWSPAHLLCPTQPGGGDCPCRGQCGP